MGTITYGIDISKWNTHEHIERCIATQMQDMPPKFCIVKATEGRTYTDPMVDEHMEWAIKKGFALGMYHYARPENNAPKYEAENFLKQYKKYADSHPIIALDWEGNALKQATGNWALEWLEYVREKTGVRPMFYTGMAFFARGEIIAQNNYGLWYAKYGSPLNHFGKWQFPAMWQFNADGLDKDKFYGSIEQFKKYGIPQTPVEELVNCPTCGRPL